MCSGSKSKPTQQGAFMEDTPYKQDVVSLNISILLELSAFDDLISFKKAIEEDGLDIDEAGLWYGRRIGSKKAMGVEERTPLMVAAMYGSKDVLNYIISSGCVDVNRVCGRDKATALHCAAAGGSPFSPEIVKLLLDVSADPNAVDANGYTPGDLIAPACVSAFNWRKKTMEVLLKGSSDMEDEQDEISTPRLLSEKKEYPVDLTLPDIKNGVYGTDEFRMYTFKVKPCSRAYSHDWTECPFVHPGENARRRDPRKYHYSCVPCPEFRKGSCRQGDACEYAHGIFECWLHPAQYRTRLCKDETNCNRRVCFFAHKPEELRPLYASTGSAVPSPRSYSGTGSSMEIGSMSHLSLGSPAVKMSSSSTPPLTPSGVVSSPMTGNSWQNMPPPPTLQLPGSRLKAALSARDMELDMELLGQSYRLRQQQLIDEISGVPGVHSPTNWNNAFSPVSMFSPSGDRAGEFNRLGGVKPTNLVDIFGSMDYPTVMPQLQSPTGMQMRPNIINPQLLSSYSTNRSSSPTSSFGMDPTSPAATVLSSRSAGFAKRSQSFIERTVVNRQSGLSSPASSATTAMNSNITDWGSPDGKLNWGFQGEEFHKLRKSASFGIRSGCSNFAATSTPMVEEEPDVSWVQTLVKDTPPMKHGQFGFEQQQQCHLDTGETEVVPAWVEQFYMDQEQMVA